MYFNHENNVSSMKLLLSIAVFPKSTVRIKKASVHFTTKPWESNAADRHIESHIFCEFRPCTNKIVCGMFEVLEPFCAFLWPFLVSSYAQNYK